MPEKLQKIDEYTYLELDRVIGVQGSGSTINKVFLEGGGAINVHEPLQKIVKKINRGRNNAKGTQRVRKGHT